MEDLSLRQRRVLALGLLAGVLTAVWFAAVMPYLGLRAYYREHIIDLRERLQQYQRIATSRQHYERRLVELKASSQLAARLLDEKTPALASAALQRTVQEMIRDSGGRLNSVQAVPPPEDAGAVVPVTLRLALQGSSEVLRSLLYRIEGGRRLLFVDTLSLHARGGTTWHGHGHGRESLDIRIDLTGYLRQSE